jgi:hypothetical protein
VERGEAGCTATQAGDAVIINPAHLSDRELEALIRVEPDTDTGREMRGRFIAELFVRRYGGWSSGYGRWPLLTWFTESERIMEPDELAAALERVRRGRSVSGAIPARVAPLTEHAEVAA